MVIVRENCPSFLESVLVHPSSVPPMFHLLANISCLLSRFRPCMDGRCGRVSRCVLPLIIVQYLQPSHPHARPPPE